MGDRAVRQPFENLLDKRKALLDLADADPHARIDIARGQHRHGERKPIVRRVAGRLACIDIAPAGATDIASRAELPGQIGAQDAGRGGAVLQRCGIVIKLDQARKPLLDLPQ